jgi:hypothetical protein
MVQILDKAEESDIHAVISDMVLPKEFFSVMSIFEKSLEYIEISIDPEDGTEKAEVEFVTNAGNILDRLETLATCCIVVTATPRFPEEQMLGIPATDESDVQTVLLLIEKPMFDAISPSN